MAKYLSGIVFGLTVLAGICTVVYLFQQPRSSDLRPLQSYSSPEQASQDFFSVIQQPLRQQSIVVVGIQPGKPELVQVLKAFMNQAAAQDFPFEAVVIDTEVERIIPEFANWNAQRINLRNQAQDLVQGLQQWQQQQVRVMVIVPVPFAARLVPESLSDGLHVRGIQTFSMVLAELPRRRETEQNVFLPCNVAERDQDGHGKLGCEILMTARFNYRHRKNPGEWVGLVKHLASDDYLVLLAREP